MAFVLDASVAACWAFDDEDHPDARLALERLRTEEALVPALWWFELRNILIVSERRQRITPPDTAVFLGAVSRLGVREDRRPVEDDILRLARVHRLSVYDAAYLEVAQREALALATLDHAMQMAALAEGIPLVSASSERAVEEPPL